MIPRTFVHLQAEYVGPPVVSHHIEIEFSLRDLADIQFRRQRRMRGDNNFPRETKSRTDIPLFCLNRDAKISG